MARTPLDGRDDAQIGVGALPPVEAAAGPAEGGRVRANLLAEVVVLGRQQAQAAEAALAEGVAVAVMLAEGGVLRPVRRVVVVALGCPRRGRAARGRGGWLGPRRPRRAATGATGGGPCGARGPGCIRPAATGYARRLTGAPSAAAASARARCCPRRAGRRGTSPRSTGI